MKDDRRVHQRVPPSEPLDARIRSIIHVHVLNLSEGGALIEVAQQLRPGSLYELRVASRGWELSLRAEVKRCHVQPGTKRSYEAGLAFSETAEEERTRLRELIELMKKKPKLGGRLTPITGL